MYDPLFVSLFGIACLLAGGVGGAALWQWARLRRDAAPPAVRNYTTLDMYLDARARDFATSRGTPGATDLVASYLKSAARTADAARRSGSRRRRRRFGSRRFRP